MTRRSVWPGPPGACGRRDVDGGRIAASAVAARLVATSAALPFVRGAA